MFTVNDLIDIAVRMEKNGEARYLAAKKQIKEKKLQSFLQWMADEEADHCQWFENKKHHWVPETHQTDLETMLPDVIKEMMGDKALSLDDVNFSQVGSARALFEIFVSFENDTILFYEFLQTFIQEPDVLAGLEKIVAQEKKHVAEIQKMIQALADEATRRTI
jgi:rubrerythrin